jgi:hypothetical protein
MEAAKKASDFLHSKINTFDLFDRYYEFCAEDFAEFAVIVDDHADLIDNLFLIKAAIAGSATQVFKVADATANEHAVNKRFLEARFAAFVATAPEALDTLNELAAALGDDPNFATTTATALGNRLRVDISNQQLTDEQKINAITNLGLYSAAIIPNVRIQGAIVETAGKTDLTAFEVNDKFSYHTNERYVVGKIISLPINVNADLDTASKIKLVIDNLY